MGLGFVLRNGAAEFTSLSSAANSAANDRVLRSCASSSLSSDVCFADEKTLCFAHDTTLDTSSRNSEPASAPLYLDLAGAAMSQSSSSSALRLLLWNLRGIAWSPKNAKNDGRRARV